MGLISLWLALATSSLVCFSALIHRYSFLIFFLSLLLSHCFFRQKIPTFGLTFSSICSLTAISMPSSVSIARHLCFCIPIQDFRYLSGAGFKSSFFFWCHLLGRVNLFLFYPSFLLSIYTQCLIEMLPG